MATNIHTVDGIKGTCFRKKKKDREYTDRPYCIGHQEEGMGGVFLFTYQVPAGVGKSRNEKESGCDYRHSI